MTIRIAIHGAAGRMGRRLVALGSADPELKVVAALESAGHSHLGEDAGVLAGVQKLFVPVSASLDVDADVLIDFSVPQAADAVIETCVNRRVALVFATTGVEPPLLERLKAASAIIPVVWSPSMSMMVNLAMKLSQVAAGTLADKDADVEIIERHHRFKEDSPSGTALKFGRLIADVMGQTAQRHGREGRPGKRPHGEIGYHAVRIGDNPGEHTILFGLLGETLEITVKASNRDCYALGAFAAAKYVFGKPPGMYGMDDVLGLKG
jgi:4-hydroxy-tetrahydrodipicolinate reductase